jgi:predicted nucleic acid-binding protein
VSSDRGIKKSLVLDCLIAASARDNRFVLVTDDARDFDLIRWPAR